MSGSLFCSLCWWVWLRQVYTPWKRCEALSAAGEKCVPHPLEQSPSLALWMCGHGHGRAIPVGRFISMWSAEQGSLA